MDESKRQHWDRVYQKAEIEQLGWYEADPEQSLALIGHCKLNPDSAILDVGAGASSLLESLLALGYRDLRALDISSEAINRARSRLGPNAAKIVWIVDDLTNPTQGETYRNIALWHDRAVLHFLIEKEDRDHYRNTLFDSLRPEGYAVIAAFSLQGAERCSGLPVHRYDVGMLQELLGKEFRLLQSHDHVHRTPKSDERPYVYTLFQRQA